MKLAINQIDPNPNQPRKRFDDLEELAASIAEKGLLEPIMVRPRGERYEIVLGERRWRAAKIAGLPAIDAAVREVDDTTAFELALVENIQRQNLTPIEEAGAFNHLSDQGMTQSAIGALIGKGQSYVAQKVRLLKLPAPLTYHLQEGALTENHVRQIMKLRGIYGEGLDSAIIRENCDPGLVDGPGEASTLINQIAPEDYPFAWVIGPCALVVEGCRRFLDYVSKHTGPVPQCEWAAFWWLSVAAHHNLTVTKLAMAMKAWEERYDHAIVWWNISAAKPEPKGKIEGEIFWGYQSDLRHSASLHAYDKPMSTERKMALLKRIHRVDTTGQWVLPSAFQHGPERRRAAA